MKRSKILLAVVLLGAVWGLFEVGGGIKGRQVGAAHHEMASVDGSFSHDTEEPSLSAGRERIQVPSVAMPEHSAEVEERPVAGMDMIPANERGSFQAALHEARYGIQEVQKSDLSGRLDLVGVTHHASNPAEDLMFLFLDNGGVRLLPGMEGRTWEGTLRLHSVSDSGMRSGARWASKSTRAERGNGNVTEWYVNRTSGLEHGFTITSPAPTQKAGEPMTLRMVLEGLAVKADDAPEREGDLVFVEAETDRPVLAYRDLKVWDADGKHLPAKMHPSADGFVIAVNEQYARYPITIDPLIVSLEQTLKATPGTSITYVKASNTRTLDEFGDSVAIDGNTVVVGAPLEDSSQVNSGAVYVFVRNRGAWSQQAILKASNPGLEDMFGSAVSISGDTLVVGAPVEASAATGINGSQTDNSAIRAGAVYVFTRTGSVWSQQAYLKASNTNAEDLFGISVAIDGDQVVVGAQNEGSSAVGVGGNQANNSAVRAGAAYVFSRSGSVWTQTAYLKASNTNAEDLFGGSVGIYFNTIVVGASRESSNARGINGNQGNNAAASSGASYVFVRSGNTWVQQAYLKASNGDAEDYFGGSVGITENTIVIGAQGERSNASGINGNQNDNSLSGAGAAYIFSRTGGTWTQQAYLKSSYPRSVAFFGSSVAVSGDNVVIGSYFEQSVATGINGNPASGDTLGAGAAFLFRRTGIAWSQIAYLKATNTQGGDEFGRSVAVSDQIVVCSAPDEDGGSTGVNGDVSSNTATNSGAVYIYESGGGAIDDHFGLSVDIDGDSAVVGALDHDHIGLLSAGKAWVFRRSGTSWAMEDDLVNGTPSAGDRFGVAVAISGNRLVIGADHDDENGKTNCGSVTAYQRNASDGTWRIMGQKLAPDVANANFGRSVAISDRHLLVGSIRGDLNFGKVWDFAWISEEEFWIQRPSLVSGARQMGALFGFSVAISNDRLVIGSPGQSYEGMPSGGMVSYFKRNTAGAWVADGQTQVMRSQARAGFSVAIHGATAVVGCSGPAGWAGGVDTPGRVGEAFVVTNNGTVWSAPTYLDASGFGAGAWFGMSVAIENNLLAVGAFGNETITGRVRIYEKVGASWNKLQDIYAASEESDNAFGVSIALSGDSLLVGGYRADSDWINSGMAWVYRINGGEVVLPQLTISRSGANVILSWPTGTGLALWRSPTMANNSWVKITGSESASSHSYLISNAPKMFFRLGPP